MFICFWLCVVVCLLWDHPCVLVFFWCVRCVFVRGSIPSFFVCANFVLGSSRNCCLAVWLLCFYWVLPIFHMGPFPTYCVFVHGVIPILFAFVCFHGTIPTCCICLVFCLCLFMGSSPRVFIHGGPPPHNVLRGHPQVVFMGP